LIQGALSCADTASSAGKSSKVALTDILTTKRVSISQKTSPSTKCGWQQNIIVCRFDLECTHNPCYFHHSTKDGKSPTQQEDVTKCLEGDENLLWAAKKIIEAIVQTFKGFSFIIDGRKIMISGPPTVIDKVIDEIRDKVGKLQLDKF